MKNLVVFLSIIILSVNSYTQTILSVPPGDGTLNEAIAANKGSVIYQLQAGQWYGLNAIIENADFNLTIVGEIPSSPTTMPAMIQIGSDGTGQPFPSMFNVFNDLTIKNVFICDANGNHIIAAAGLMIVKNTCKIVIDNVVFDPLDAANCLINVGTFQNMKIFLTNSQILRSGNEVNPNDGGIFVIAVEGANPGFDTLYVENNSFISTGTWFVVNWENSAMLDNFIWINHNTFIQHKSQLDQSWLENQYFFTNNLLFDFNTQPYQIAWNIYYPDGSAIPGTMQSKMSLLNIDTLQGEVLPSSRKNFIAYNLNRTNPKFQQIVDWGNNPANTLNNDGVTPIPKSYLMPLIWPQDSANVNREANMFYGSVGFPNFKYVNTINDDPQFTESRIYALSDSLAEWTFPATKQHCWGFDPANVPPVTTWPKFWWNADDNGLGDPRAWPRFDGTYTNQTVLTASIEKLPLGDLNWFPEAKAKWAANQAMIQEHILACNEEPINLTGVTLTDSKIPTNYSLSQNYPNPFNPSTAIKFSTPLSGDVSLRVYTLLGQEVASLINQEMTAGSYEFTFNALNLNSGLYFYRLNVNGFTLTKKMMLIK